jgi:hypothetical protein
MVGIEALELTFNLSDALLVTDTEGLSFITWQSKSILRGRQTNKQTNTCGHVPLCCNLSKEVVQKLADH